MKVKIAANKYVSQPNGRSYYLCECPFCENEVKFYAWRGVKKCNCGAVLHAVSVVAIKELEEKK